MAGTSVRRVITAIERRPVRSSWMEGMAFRTRITAPMEFHRGLTSRWSKVCR